MKKLSQEFSKAESRILGASSPLDDFLMNPLNQGHSRTAPKTSRNAFVTNQGTSEDDSHSDLHPEASIFFNQTPQDSGPQGRHNMVTGVQKESLCDHDMVTGFHEEFTYCSLNASSGNQKKNRSTNQPKFRRENTPGTIEADQFMLALLQLTNNNNSANFHNDLNRISKLTK